ncbi:MAG: hypothetical protein OIF57_17755 [Marinobacterium sp.]|nr:hypothetical protein [Marinobacterium sp.]
MTTQNRFSSGYQPATAMPGVNVMNNTTGTGLQQHKRNGWQRGKTQQMTE